MATDQAATIQALRDELDTAMAELEEAGDIKEIATVLAEMLELMKARKEQAATPVTVHVAAPQVTIAQPDMEIDYFTHEYDGEKRLIKSIPHRSPRKAAA